MGEHAFYFYEQFILDNVSGESLFSLWSKSKRNSNSIF